MRNEEPRTMNKAKMRFPRRPFVIAVILTAILFGMGALYVWQARASIHAKMEKGRARLYQKKEAGERALKNVDIDHLPADSAVWGHVELGFLGPGVKMQLDLANFLEACGLPLA